MASVTKLPLLEATVPDGAKSLWVAAVAQEDAVAANPSELWHQAIKSPANTLQLTFSPVKSGGFGCKHPCQSRWVLSLSLGFSAQPVGTAPLRTTPPL
jgi:hypothetical protein